MRPIGNKSKSPAKLKKRPAKKAKNISKGKIIAGTIIAVVIIAGVIAANLLFNEKNTEMKLLEQNIDGIEPFANQAELDPYLVAAIARAESSFNPQAQSSVGAMGYMQIMPETGEWIAQKLKIKDFTTDMLLDKDVSLRMGCWYLKFLQERFENKYTVIAAYNAGHGIVAKWLEQSEYSEDGVTLKNIPYGETERYVKKVKKYYEMYTE